MKKGRVNKMLSQIREGDILLVVVGREIPRGVQPTNGQVVLAEGELTGHSHVLTAPVVYDWSEDGQRYIRVSGAMGQITHQEHDPLPASVVDPDVTYRVIQQQEWNLEGQWRKVQD